MSAAHVVVTVADDPGFLDGGFEGWWEALDAGARHDLPTASTWPREEARAALAHPVPWEDMLVLRAVDGVGRVVGAGYVDVPLRENRDTVSAEVVVPAEHRRRGVGSAMVRAVCDVAEGLGRTRVLGEVALPLGREPSGWPGCAATRAWGARLGLADVRRDMPLPLDAAAAAHLRDLRVEALPHARGYRWDVVRGALSAQDAAGTAELASRFWSEAPQGDLDLEDEDVDVERVQAAGARDVALGRTCWTAVARREDGEVAGWSRLQRSVHEPDVLRQEDTLVLPDHRGHRLGLLLKLATLEAALADGRAEGWGPEPSLGLRAVRTWNAASNGPMVAVNEAMGFRPVEDLHEVVADVTALRAAVGR
ncbi:GNAT family N-acetyltransferase [Pseudokineococcus sp. 1T1Z-3]|uniref:GNAT family N-acetyltransferase n=1 Tax=Pseudokineococcus sp. 1T1Z-3 TaxID=3132745 RepID=UPI0030B6E8EA